jgi:predicted RND superfamily exporter protein
MTSFAQRFADALTAHSRAVIAVLLVLTLAIGVGAPMVEQESGLQQFQGDSEAANASAFISKNFVADGAENQTTIQIIRRGDGENVFTRESFVDSLEFQQQIRAHPEIGPTLADRDAPPRGADPTLAAQTGNAMFGIGNILALYELNRTVPSTGGNQTAGLNFSGLATAESTSEVRLADLGIRNFSDIPGGFGGSGAEGTPFDAIEGVNNFSEFNAEFDSIGEIPLTRIRPSAVGFRGVETLPPVDCLASFASLRPGETPPLSCQVWALEDMNRTEFERAASVMLGENGELDALALLPQSYEPGSTMATSHSMAITQQTEGGSLQSRFSENVTSAQLELRNLAAQQDSEYMVFGLAIITDEVDQSLGDSTAIVGPIALLFVIVVLTIAYRDLLDILLGVVGILLVLLWTFGFMGWTGIDFNQLMISVPVLLIGLSIDYAIHVFMRHREQRGPDEDLRRSMAVALAGVGVALVWVTATAAIGFLSNLTSPIGPLQDFGVASAFGITAALIIFGGLIPALKIELDGLLEARGIDRQKRAFGTGDSALSGVLAVGARAARTAPVAVLVLTLVLSAGGVYGASQVDTSFKQEDFLADTPPEWTESLPGPMEPGEYQVKQDLAFVQENYQQVGRQGELVVRGNVTSPQAMEALATLRENASRYDSVYILPNDQPDVRTPLTAMRLTAELNDSFARGFERATTGDENASVPASLSRRTDGVPQRNVAELYDRLLVRNPAASEVVYRNGAGEYEALRVQIGVTGNATAADGAADTRALAADLEAASDGQLDVVATGDPVINNEVEQSLLNTVIESLLITLVAVFVFLAVAYRLTGSSASLGVVTLLPVLFSVTWILGTMWLIGMPFNALTGTITSLTVGLGIAYSIHISARYELELRRQEHVWDALETTVTGTGGALLGSAATTVGGFGTLALAILPALEQFGIITGLTIIYAFLASILVLPALLVLWTRYLGPSGYFPETESDAPAATGETAGATADSESQD